MKPKKKRPRATHVEIARLRGELAAAADLLDRHLRASRADADRASAALKHEQSMRDQAIHAFEGTSRTLEALQRAVDAIAPEVGKNLEALVKVAHGAAMPCRHSLSHLGRVGMVTWCADCGHECQITE